MAHLKASDGVELYYEETGSGTPVVFVYELAGDSRSFEPRVRYFSRVLRCITYNVRGYPPSQVPPDVASYSQDRAVDDIRDLMDTLGVEKAHLIGVSMGGSAVLHFRTALPASRLIIGGRGGWLWLRPRTARGVPQGSRDDGAPDRRRRNGRFLPDHRRR